MNKNYIWSLPSRVFHWGFVLLIIIAFLSADKDTILIHTISGYLLVIALLFRFSWGVFGPKYSKFRDFPLGIKRAKDFAKNILNPKEEFLGHNPMASYVMLAILIVVAIIIFTGTLAYGSQEAKGFFSFLVKDKVYKHIHEFFANFLYLLIFLHLCGIFIDRVLHKENQTLKSIFNGFKYSKEKENIKLNIFQKLFAFLFLIIFFSFLIYLIVDKTNPFIY
ncbi:cytochrome b/b6 domain-containing protein [Halarcobacter ebronensis]|uniref:Cytochrome B n=1 Tax=Halarcobacter ebronensis TaxID=1462615 RepID=A0A4Q1AY36_9BACT|nr:cytochrome b/b6 domain-containing protein [Halarcobacter ebronensis]QKF83497.1 cytochrome b [Halarcobacter ebronensis]RXK08291.1 cytochrome B [Halarcobacter ebronensis]